MSRQQGNVLDQEEKTRYRRKKGKGKKKFGLKITMTSRIGVLNKHSWIEKYKTVEAREQALKQFNSNYMGNGHYTFEKIDL